MHLAKRLSVCLALVIAMFATSGATSAEPLPAPFGLQFAGVNETLLDVADQLGAPYVRSRVFVEDWDGTCGGCKPFLARGKRLVLTARFNGSDKSASGVPNDLESYKNDLRNIVDSLRPDLLVVENEQDAPTFYSGTPFQYLTTLRAACEVAHASGIPCSDGGLSNPSVIVAVYQRYLDYGMQQAADSYARQTLTDDEYRRLVNPANALAVRRAAQRVWSFIDGYRAAGADYVNFHWYRDSASAFTETVKVLEQATRLPAISNEIGQYHDDPSVISAIMGEVLSNGFDYAIWFNIDYTVPNGNRIHALAEEDGSLRPHGQAFRSIIESLP